MANAGDGITRRPRQMYGESEYTEQVGKDKKNAAFPTSLHKADKRPPFKGIDTSWPSQTFRTVANLLLARVPRSPIIASKSPNSAETRHRKLSATAREQVREPGALQTFIPKSAYEDELLEAGLCW
ncbi:hypothetical protein CPB85DRAFT_1256006 [Mucidula mucida]|nr:hypothetical protein CPB85DRAFT_1256006 [Mucidula mucida]